MIVSQTERDHKNTYNANSYHNACENSIKYIRDRPYIIERIQRCGTNFDTLKSIEYQPKNVSRQFRFRKYQLVIVLL